MSERQTAASESNGSIELLVVNSQDLTQRLLDATDAEAVWTIGIDLSQPGMSAEDSALELGVSLWLIWGSLTDAIDHPYADPDPSAAVQNMRRAAEEWLAVGGDPDARHAYCDRWRYDECGYERDDQ